MKPILALLLLLPLALAGCGDDKPKAAPTFEEVTFQPVEGVAAERVKADLDKPTQGYITDLTKQLGTLNVSVANINLSPNKSSDRAVLLGVKPCKPETCFIVIAHKPENAPEQVLNMFGFNPDVEKLYLTYMLSSDGLRDVLVVKGDKAQRFRYQINLVNVDDGEAGSYMSIGFEPFPPSPPEGPKS